MALSGAGSLPWGLVRSVWLKDITPLQEDCFFPECSTSEDVNYLEALAWQVFEGPFPYEDCRRLRKQAGLEDDRLVACLDLYFADMFGLSAYACQLHLRSAGKHAEDEQVMQLDVFQRFEYLEGYRPLITETNTPRIYKRLIASEHLRAGVLVILGELGR